MKTEELIVKGILSCCTPQNIILYSEKTSLYDHCLRAANFCVIVQTDDKKELIRKLYLSIPADIPFDILLYTPKEWEKMTADSASYASHILRKGKVIYEQT